MPSASSTCSASRAQRSPFFFSSRRRHTRCSRDWSSDVALPILSSAGTIYWPIADTTPSTSQNDKLLPYAGQNEIGRASCRERGQKPAVGGRGKRKENKGCRAPRGGQTRTHTSRSATDSCRRRTAATARCRHGCPRRRAPARPAAPSARLFFFQAEDGIRDVAVTGVQTLLFRSCRAQAQFTGPSRTPPPPPARMTNCFRMRDKTRSEERRVGKEDKNRRWEGEEKEKKIKDAEHHEEDKLVHIRAGVLPIAADDEQQRQLGVATDALGVEHLLGQPRPALAFFFFKQKTAYEM